MGVGMADIEYLSSNGHLPEGQAALLDVGSQNLFNLQPDAVRAFVRRYGAPASMSSDELGREIQRISYFSTPRPGERTTYLSELFDLTPSIFYTSYDVCPALKTEIFDLNAEDLPSHYRNRFDVVMNCGTTEHVINQMNSYKVMHEATKVGGVLFHQLPSVGWLDHGYYTYHETFFTDLISANGYELVDTWYTPERIMMLPETADIRNALTPNVKRSADRATLQLHVQCFNLTTVLRKTSDKPFRVGLELATSHSALSETVQQKYAR